ncbi:PIKFYVE [Cordylochernes scorpioides]|uniref:PIKFYVE n=1 Tax=Cordylochernes scorpioides TaxID=51811 RepID=A0ABY6KWB4_9ARAC|nr:PIKFYVE [Cordylochernes scorpioides]
MMLLTTVHARGYEVFNLIKEKLNSLQQDCADSQFDQMLNEMNECHQGLETEGSSQMPLSENSLRPSLMEVPEETNTSPISIGPLRSKSLQNLSETNVKEPLVRADSAPGSLWNPAKDPTWASPSAHFDEMKRYLPKKVETLLRHRRSISQIQANPPASTRHERSRSDGSETIMATMPSRIKVCGKRKRRPWLGDLPIFRNHAPQQREQRLFEVKPFCPGFDFVSHRYGGSTNLHQVLCEKRIQGCRKFLDVANSLRGCHHEPMTTNPPASTRHERSRSDGSETIMATMPSRIKVCGKRKRRPWLGDLPILRNHTPQQHEQWLFEVKPFCPCFDIVSHRYGGSTNLHQVLCEKRIQGCRRRVFEWIKCFKESREETADKERSGRLSTSTTPEKSGQGVGTAVVASKHPDVQIPIVVHDDDPGSLIAYVLTSKDYETQLQELNVAASVLKEGTSSSQLVQSPNQSGAGSVGPSPECKQQHIEVQASDPTLRIYCKIYFAEHFRRLRALVLPQGEERFIRSLASCIPWAARGGKSGLKFRKTKDDRFVLKEMSKLEIQSFLEFGPHYLNYIYKACTQQMPTVLGKIMGVYRIGYKNSVNNTSHRADVLVMENLFYGRCISQKFDLKGSVRNRLVSPNTSRQDPGEIVLLDENLLKMLTLAINNDARFLCEQSVMDYSLLVGVDDLNKELVVGIIDYIRTFTWDKKLEMVVKSSGILGGHGKLPTVVSPEIYQARFCEAMDKYFLYVPDRWFTLGKDLAH